MRLQAGKLIPRDDGKRIEEFVGNATTRTPSVSVAHMWAPAEWKEPAQTPQFDEVVIVLRGVLTLVIDGRAEKISPGEVGFVPKGKRVIYRNDSRSACDYWSICAPAFRPELAKMDPPLKVRAQSNEVALDLAHPKAERLEGLLRTQSLRFMRALKLKQRELSLSVVSDREIRKLNKSWRGKDKATDVLSFPSGGLPKGVPGRAPLGDIVISLDTAERVAKSLRVPVEAELCRYLAHGLLHLLGHDHLKPADAKKMRALELKLLGDDGLIGEGVFGE